MRMYCCEKRCRQATRIHLGRVLLAAFALFAAASVHTQQFPTRPVRFVVPYPPGGSHDILARMLVPRMGEQLGQNVVVDNRGGANAIIGSEIVAKAVPDGHTVLIIGGSHVINPSVYPKLPYNTARDFAPIALIGDGSYVLAAHSSLAVTSAANLIALTRSKPGEIVYASSGMGNLTHLMQSGKIKGLGVTTARRSRVLPNLPTIAEPGLPGYEVSGWYGLVAPAATPQAAIARLHSVVEVVLVQSEIKEKLLSVGVDAVESTPAQFGKKINTELARWNKIVKPLGITPE